MEMEAMDKALALPEIIEHILPFLDNQSFLKTRLLNTFWNAEVLRAFSRREGFYLGDSLYWEESLYLNLGTYMDERYIEGGPLLPQGSRLATRVCAGGAQDVRDPKDFLHFFTSGYGVQTEVLYLNHSIHKEDRFLTWGGVLHEILRNNLAPKLRKLVLDFNPEGVVNNIFENGDTDFSASLCGLRVLVLYNCCYGIIEGPFTPFVAAILRGARNLEKLIIQGDFFPQTTDIATLRNLKVLEISHAHSSWIPELERVLRDFSTQCPSLESLSLPFLVDDDFEGVLNFPRFPRLKVFTFRDVRRLPLEGDLTRFLREKLPVLSSLITDADWSSNEAPVENAAVICKALHSSQGSHHGLQFLSTPAPTDPTLLEGLQAKLPSLKRLDLSRYVRMNGTEEEKPVDWLTDLALVLASNNSLYSAISTVLAQGDEAEEVRAKFLVAVGPEWRGEGTNHFHYEEAS